MGKIKLEGIEVMARIGLLEEELFAPQDLRVTVELTYDFETIRETDEITDGIDYRTVIEKVRGFCTKYDGKTPTLRSPSRLRTERLLSRPNRKIDRGQAPLHQEAGLGRNPRRG